MYAGSYSIKITICDRYGKMTNFDLKIIITSPEEQISIITEGNKANLQQALSIEDI
jgi:hypothetical protein